MKSIQRPLSRLQYLCSVIPALLRETDEDAFAAKPSPCKWSKKEIIGHLIDSATNNHHRIIRGQFETSPDIFYDQDKWNENSFYQDMEKEKIISFWLHYNLYLIELFQRIPPEKLSYTVSRGAEKDLTLKYIIEDYVAHLEHHLRQVVKY